MRTTRLLAGALAASATLLAAPALAWGHAEFEAEGPVVQGGYATLTLSMPNERPDASTVEVAVQMPTDTPIALVAPEAPEGWEVSTTTRQLPSPIVVDGVTITSVVDVITWSTTTAPLGPGEVRGSFTVTMGPFPIGVDSVSFPTVQGYDNGERVRWIEPPLAGGGEAEFPLPTLDVGVGSGTVEPIPDNLRAVADAATTTTAPPAPSTEAPTTVAPTTAAAATAAPDVTIEAVPTAADSTPALIAPAPTAAESSDGGGSSVVWGVAAVAAVLVAGGALAAMRRRRS